MKALLACGVQYAKARPRFPLDDELFKWTGLDANFEVCPEFLHMLQWEVPLAGGRVVEQQKV